MTVKRKIKVVNKTSTILNVSSPNEKFIPRDFIQVISLLLLISIDLFVVKQVVKIVVYKKWIMQKNFANLLIMISLFNSGEAIKSDAINGEKISIIIAVIDVILFPR